jgi:hypothetical protein
MKSHRNMPIGGSENQRSRPNRPLMLTKPVRDHLNQVISDARAYRSAFNRIFSRKLTKPWACAKYFFRLLVLTSQIYHDSLFLTGMQSKIPAVRTPFEPCRTPPDLDRKVKFREKFDQRLESLPCWSAFDLTHNVFFEENRLRTKQDYVFNLALHLPEIYAEITSLETVARQVLHEKRFTDQSLGELLIGLQHAAHHASYCRHALEVLSDEHSWMPPYQSERKRLKPTAA